MNDSLIYMHLHKNHNKYYFIFYQSFRSAQYIPKDSVKKNILDALKNYKNRVKVTLVPNITNICYGRGVGYKIEEIVLDEKTQQISATKIREQMRKDGKLK